MRPDFLLTLHPKQQCTGMSADAGWDGSTAPHVRDVQTHNTMSLFPLYFCFEKVIFF